MTHACQVTEIPLKGFPELFQFYYHFPKKYPFLLSTTSQSGEKQNSNYDILFIDPGDWLKLDHNLKLQTSSQYDINPDELFLDAFDRVFLHEQKVFTPKRAAQTTESNNLPFSGGWFVFLAYELAQQIEPCLNLPLQEQELPVACAVRVKSALIYDHRQNKLFLVSESDVELDKVRHALIQDSLTIQRNTKDIIKPEVQIDNLYEEDEKNFLNSVDVVKDYIKEGDVFQVNLSRLWQTKSGQSELTNTSHSHLSSNLFQLLSVANPAPFSGLASFASEQGIATIISSSPERLLKIQNNKLESRPIAGTHPRGFSEQEDLRLIDELHAHPKEQAEHIMLIDLIRNDLGRVCVPGTVKVNELMVNESYAHVHHIVSNVIGQLQKNKTPGDAIKAMFPGGTITGCPKIRCMEIIAELEQQARGAYTGSMGYINLDGSMDLNILIRTMVLQQGADKAQKLSFRAGAGLVFDSIAEQELQETRSKAKGLVKALQSKLSEEFL